MHGIQSPLSALSQYGRKSSGMNCNWKKKHCKKVKGSRFHSFWLGSWFQKCLLRRKGKFVTPFWNFSVKLWCIPPGGRGVPYKGTRMFINYTPKRWISIGAVYILFNHNYFTPYLLNSRVQLVNFFLVCKVILMSLKGFKFLNRQASW